jgi:translation initiation factor 2B subunit (eIF-2B alpha/beta/delta family)
VRDLRGRAEAIAADRARGASDLLAELLPLLDAAIAAGRDTTLDVVRCVCAGQSAMAPLWNACAASLAEFAHPGHFARRRAEFERAPRALVRAATAALGDALQGIDTPQILTVSHSGSVARTLRELATARAIAVVCSESLPGGEGMALADHLNGAGVNAEAVSDTAMTTYLSTAAAVVVGADAVAARTWTNKAGTYGLAAAAWFSGVPVYVVASRDKAESELLTPHLQLPRTFERTPIQLATLVLTEAGPVPPDAISGMAERFRFDLPFLLSCL